MGDTREEGCCFCDAAGDVATVIILVEAAIAALNLRSSHLNGEVLSG